MIKWLKTFRSLVSFVFEGGAVHYINESQKPDVIVPSKTIQQGLLKGLIRRLEGLNEITVASFKTKFLRVIKELRYAAYLTTHPAKGFWEIKQEGEGSLFTAMLIFFGTVFVMILRELYTGFIFSGGRAVYYDFTNTIISMSSLFFGWCVANWCLTCLFDGEGKLRDIIKATGYALLPFMLIQFIMVILSNYFIEREEIFYDMLNSISMAWMIGLIIMSVMITHQYAVLKTILVCFFSVLAMMMIAFIILLIFNLTNQVGDFIGVFMDELQLRMAGG